MRRPILLVAVTMMLVTSRLSSQQARTAVSSRQGPRIGVIEGRHGFDEEAGCVLLFPSDKFQSDRYVFLSSFNGRALMRIDRQNVELELVRREESKAPRKKGDRSRDWYVAGPIRVRVDYTISSFCPQSYESCEVISYRAVIHVTAKSGKRSVSAYGSCGS